MEIRRMGQNVSIDSLVRKFSRYTAGAYTKNVTATLDGSEVRLHCWCPQVGVDIVRVKM